jgi:hypothetical protein
MFWVGNVDLIHPAMPGRLVCDLIHPAMGGRLVPAKKAMTAKAANHEM